MPLVYVFHDLRILNAAIEYANRYGEDWVTTGRESGMGVR